jgi:hypothetical protein
MGSSRAASATHSSLLIIHKNLWDTNNAIFRAHVNSW